MTKPVINQITDFVSELVQGGICKKNPTLNVWSGRKIRLNKNSGFPASRRAAERNRKRNEGMKRTETLTEIQWAGWHGNTERAASLIRQKNIGKAAGRKAYMDGQKMKERGEPCGCVDCTSKKKK